MTQLHEYIVEPEMDHGFIESNLMINAINLKLNNAYDFLNQQFLVNKHNLVVRFNDYLYLDEIYNDLEIRTHIETLFFKFIENHRQDKRFIFFCFKIKSKDIDALIHNGFDEWLFYLLTFFKYTRLNIVIEMDQSSFSESHVPIEYLIVKRYDNPRIGLFINDNGVSGNSKKIIPEDISAFTTIVDDRDLCKEGKYPYAMFYLFSDNF